MEEEKKAICKNPWCKATFFYNEESAPEFCKKCESFNNELSGGVSWTTKNYEGSRYDGMPHLTSIKVNKYFK